LPGDQPYPRDLESTLDLSSVGHRFLVALEDQMCDYVPMDSKSPDRMDALVWALTELSGDWEEEVIYEYDERHSISPDLDAFDRLPYWKM